MSNKATMIVFSGDLDKAIASFIIATGAAAMNKEVTMFFTFWGLNILRKEQYMPARKGLLDRLFERLMPRGPGKLGLSKLNFGGIGAGLMRHVMHRKNVSSLPELMDLARELGIKMVACQMSMDVLGLEREELIDGLEFAGVATYLAEADSANLNLFI